MKKINKKEIIIVINEKSQLYNQFNNSQLSDELHQYIYNQFKGVSLKTDIFISVYHNFELSNYEKRKLVNEIREDFGLDIKENLIALKSESYKRSILFILGMILTAISHLFKADYFYLVSQFFSIFGWIMIWEYIYSLIFFSTRTKYENKKFNKLINAKVHFTRYE